MTPLERSRRSKKAWRSRKRQDAARGAPERGGASPPVQRKSSVAVGYDKVIAATTPDKSSAVIAAELGISAAAVRAYWRRKGLPRRPVGKRPKICAG